MKRDALRVPPESITIHLAVNSVVYVNHISAPVHTYTMSLLAPFSSSQHTKEKRAASGLGGACNTQVQIQSTSDANIDSIWPSWGSALIILSFFFVLAVFVGIVVVFIFQSQFYRHMGKIMKNVSSVSSG